VIDPAVPITHLDPDGMRRLMSLVVQRSGADDIQLTVLHDAGRVVGVVHSVEGHVDGHREPVSDPQATAAALLKETGVDRVVVLDRPRLEDLAAAVVDAARWNPSQGDLLLAAHDLYWSHPAVATAPAPPLPTWAPFRDLLRALPDGWLHIQVGGAGEDEPVLVACLRLANGSISEITGRDPGIEPRLRLDLTWDHVARIANAPDPTAALVDVLDEIAHAERPDSPTPSLTPDP